MSWFNKNGHLLRKNGKKYWQKRSRKVLELKNYSKISSTTKRFLKSVEIVTVEMFYSSAKISGSFSWEISILGKKPTRRVIGETTRNVRFLPSNKPCPTNCGTSQNLLQNWGFFPLSRFEVKSSLLILVKSFMEDWVFCWSSKCFIWQKRIFVQKFMEIIFKIKIVLEFKDIL